MLKRLIRYGNSQALVIDKALLEILNFKEGDLIKIKTDGRSLILSPAEDGSEASRPTPMKKIGITAEEAKAQHEKAETERLMREKPMTPQMWQDISALNLKYATALGKLAMVTASISSKNDAAYAEHGNADRYMTEFLIARAQAVPELKEFDREQITLAEKHGVASEHLVKSFEISWKEPYKSNQHQS